jgi:hypothetical protein
MEWYRKRGLTKTETVVLEKDSSFNNRKAGESVEMEKITEQYSGGRIDVYGTGDPYGEEIGVPPMKTEDWNRFGNWLENFRTTTMLSLEELVAEYEKTNPAIQWDKVND